MLFQQPDVHQISATVYTVSSPAAMWNTWPLSSLRPDWPTLANCWTITRTSDEYSTEILNDNQPLMKIRSLNTHVTTVRRTVVLWTTFQQTFCQQSVLKRLPRRVSPTVPNCVLPLQLTVPVHSVFLRQRQYYWRTVRLNLNQMCRSFQHIAE